MTSLKSGPSAKWSPKPLLCVPSTAALNAHHLRDKDKKISASQLGSSLPGLRTLPLSPQSTLAESFQSTCLQSHLQTSLPTPQKSYSKFRNPRTTFQNTPFSAQKLHSAG